MYHPSNTFSSNATLPKHKCDERPIIFLFVVFKCHWPGPILTLLAVTF